MPLLALAGCSEESRYISEEQAAEYAQRNREVADALPVPDGARLVNQEENDCAGALKHDASSACFLNLFFETTRPQIAAMESYRGYFREQKWEVVADDPIRETGVFFGNQESLVQVSLSIPLDLCPDADTRFQEYIACLATEIRRDDGRIREYRIIVSPT
jgi:hypothetical protein